MAKKNDSQSPLNPLQIILIVALIAAAGTIGHLWTKLNYMDQAPTENVKQAADNNPTPAQPQFPSVDNLEPISQEDHIRGNPDAQIALIGYSDLECPYCVDFHQTAQQLLEEYDGQIMWIYRHYPLEQLHSNATELAIGSECAARQGDDDSFWAFIDYVFENESTDAQKVAQALGFNTAQFSTCLDDESLAQKVQDQLNAGSAAGVTGTPGNILLNTQTNDAILVPGARPVDQFKTIIDQQLLDS